MKSFSAMARAFASITFHPMMLIPKSTNSRSRKTAFSPIDSFNFHRETTYFQRQVMEGKNILSGYTNGDQ